MGVFIDFVKLGKIHELGIVPDPMVRLVTYDEVKTIAPTRSVMLCIFDTQNRFYSE